MLISLCISTLNKHDLGLKTYLAFIVLPAFDFGLYDFISGHILTSSLASSLPTLPFIVLKSLFDACPLTTDDGVLLRRMCLDIGALQLILACLSVLSHHAPRVAVPGFQQEVSLTVQLLLTLVR